MATAAAKQPRSKPGRAAKPATRRAKRAPDYDDRLKEHRARQASVAAVLDELFGPLEKCKPRRWEYRAYLLVVGLIYTRLSTDCELETKDIVDLAKVLAEQRRARAVARTAAAKAGKKPKASKAEGELPENFGEIVRRIYGTNFQAVGETPTRQNVKTPKPAADNA
jgi:hypothetical protein